MVSCYVYPIILEIYNVYLQSKLYIIKLLITLKIHEKNIFLQYHCWRRKLLFQVV